MSFTSFSFLLFVAIVVVAYYVVPKKVRWVLLLAASYAFYLISSANTLAFLVATTLVTFFGGKFLGRVNAETRSAIAEGGSSLDRAAKKELKSAAKKRKRGVVALVLVIDFGILAALKYFSVYLEAFSDVLGFSFDAGVLIPLGISFYTFQSAAYIIDLYRDKIAPDTNIAKFALFLSFFPQIIQGPIPRHDQLAAQLYKGHSFKYENLCHGAQLMLWGFFKKLIIADRCAILVDQVFQNHASYSGWAVAVALVFYSIVIYADFSGGIDIARGVARILGIDMPHNFRRPYFAENLSEFWRRWHISLSSWTRDYIFFPISLSKFFGKVGKSLRGVLGNRVGKLFPIIVAQLATFTIIGLWHGAAFKYVAYGWYNGLIIVAALLLEPAFDKAADKIHLNRESLPWRVFCMIRTFLIVSLGRSFPRAASFTAAVSMMGSLFAVSSTRGVGATVDSFGLDVIDYAIVAIACLIWFVVSLIEELQEAKAQKEQGTKKGIVPGKDGAVGVAETGAEVRLLIDRLPFAARWVIYLAGFLAVLCFGVYGPGYDAASFIYRGF